MYVMPSNVAIHTLCTFPLLHVHTRNVPYRRLLLEDFLNQLKITHIHLCSVTNCPTKVVQMY